MAGTVPFKLKRSLITGTVPLTTDLAIGELGINIPDRKIFSSNGSVVFELGANTTDSSVANTLIINKLSSNGSVGSNGQVLTSNGTGTYWQTLSSGITRAESSQLTMPSGGGWTTFAHGLGVTPKRWGAYAICITATTDFAVGDMISFDTDHGYSTLTTVAANATSVKFGLNNGYLYGGPNWNNLLNANFKLVLWAEK